MLVPPNHQTKEKTMTTKIFVNFPVTDLNKSMAFFKSLGWTFNLQFTDDCATSHRK